MQATAVPTSATPTALYRVGSVDALRGMVMIIMALDHVREYFHAGLLSYQPEDLTRTTAAVFFTRWITHICAPVFMFTAGLAAWFWLSRGRTTAQLSRFLWKRGLWLVLLELTVFRFVVNLSLIHGVLILTVLWALGWSMVALGFLVRLPLRILTVLSLAVILLHNLADPVDASRFGAAAWIWNVLHQSGMFPVGAASVVVGYPLVPWIAVMASGFCFGPLLSLPPTRRRNWLLGIGLGLTIAFFVLRGINIYGDPVPWSWQPPGMPVLSFLRVNKYPPSLDFLLITLGPAILLLACFDRLRFSAANPLLVFGRVPLFFFVVHFYAVHFLAFPLAWLRYGRAAFLLNPFPSFTGPDPYPADYGFSLPVVYLIWIAVVLFMYPLCLWFSRVKQRRRDWWLSYL